MRTLICLVLVVFLFNTTGAESAHDKGAEAYEQGDYATALREFTLLAEQGHAGAQAALALMYDEGRGVPQDHLKAGLWYMLAAEQGETQAQFKLAFLDHIYTFAGTQVHQHHFSIAWQILFNRPR